jgi:hypothetical protein
MNIESIQKISYFSLILIAIVSILSACSEDVVEPKSKQGTVDIKTVYDLPADAGTPQGTPVTNFTYFSFATGDSVPASIANSDNWDIAFAQTTIKTNDKCKVLVLEQTDFYSLLEAPATGYNSSSKISWYNYNPTNHQISPIPGVVLVFKTSNDKYAKMLILNYYKGHPETYTEDAISRYYSFKYAYQPDGTRNF